MPYLRRIPVLGHDAPQVGLPLTPVGKVPSPPAYGLAQLLELRPERLWRRRWTVLQDVLL